MDSGTASVLTAHSHQSVAPRIHRICVLVEKWVTPPTHSWPVPPEHSEDGELCGKHKAPASEQEAHASCSAHCEVETSLPGDRAGFCSETVLLRCVQLRSTYCFHWECYFEDLVLVPTGRLKGRCRILLWATVSLTESLPDTSSWPVRVTRTGQGLCTFLHASGVSTILTRLFLWMNILHSQTAFVFLILTRGYAYWF